MVCCLRLDADSPVSPKTRRLGGVVADGVLVTDVASNFLRDFIHILQGIGEVGDPACLR